MFGVLSPFKGNHQLDGKGHSLISLSDQQENTTTVDEYRTESEHIMFLALQCPKLKQGWYLG